MWRTDFDYMIGLCPMRVFWDGVMCGDSNIAVINSISAAEEKFDYHTFRGG